MATVEVVPANLVLFGDLCEVLDSIYKKKKDRTEQDKILTRFIDGFRLNAQKVDGNKDCSFFPILRLLLPECDRERGPYNMKAPKLGALLVKVLALNPSTAAAKKLTEYRSVNTQESDFAGVAYFEIKNRMSQKTSTFTIQDVNNVLDKIATAHGEKGPILDDAFSHVMRNATAEQMKWFLRIILKDLKLGMSMNRILAAFHPQGPEYYNNCSNLVEMCKDLKDRSTRPQLLGVRLFRLVRPMLSARLPVTRAALLPAQPYYIEEKFDGERFQMHMQNGVFQYLSRKGHPYSDNYGESYESGLLTPFLKDCFSATVDSVILDGEMMGWHKQNQKFSTKGVAFDVKKITVNSHYRPCFCVFDVLYYNGAVLVGPAEGGGGGGRPLRERAALLDSIVSDVPGVIVKSKRKLVKNSSDILEALNNSIKNEEEGIVVKATESYYIPNERNAGWYKIKGEYTDSTMSDLDLVIIGAEEAEDKRHGRAKSFLVACADAAAPGLKPHRWVSVGRVATGLSDEERASVCETLEQHWMPRRSAPPPACLYFNKEQPDLWVLPEHSIVLQVRATELIRSKDFGTAYTLRFPRVMRIRRDKPVDDVMTLQDFQALIADKGPVIKLSTTTVDESQVESEVRVRRKRTAQVLKVAEQFRARPAGEVEVVSKALQGREICVLSDTEDCKKSELIGIVESHGGKHVENVGPNTWCCVAGRLNFRVNSYITAQEVNIVSAAWLRSLPPSDTICSLSPIDMISINKKTKLALSRDYDRFGDSYQAFTNEDLLRACFAKMDELKEPQIFLTTQEMLNLDMKLFGDNNPFSFLRSCFIHFPSKNVQSVQAKMYGASLCEKTSPTLSHIVLPAEAKDDEIIDAKRLFRGLVVSEKWLNECFERKQYVSEKEFLL
ncbi:LOW QUALITY PROTEIN: DNA ligase 4 [Choristoneura fumiferana]|uniref:LOW QUALITY PROTEIN: DNA ligase 4 n=1 Tax=Choristoneura fumiferana TaxID=7141 RepID=UPI003D15F061